MPTARVQSRGQVTVPQEIRDACHIEPGADLYFVQTAPDRFECQVLPPSRTLREVLDRFTLDGVAPDLSQLREEMGMEMTRRRSSDFPNLRNTFLEFE